MHILVTGGNGFIGRGLVEALVLQGHRIRVVSRRDASSQLPGVEWVQADLTAETCPMRDLVRECDIVYHCAGEVRNEANMRRLHVDATRRLLQAARNEASSRGQPIHWVQLSSVGIYGPAEIGANSERIVTEESPINPAGEYELTKALSDEMVTEACEDRSISFSILRPSNVFGQGMTNQSLRSMGAMINKGLFFYIGKPGAVATYVHVADVVDVLVRCGFEMKARGQIFNISNDCALEDLIESMAATLGAKPPRIRLPERFIRCIAYMTSGIKRMPLTQERIDVLVSRTRYPTTKLESELGYRVTRAVPDYINQAL